MKRPAPFSLLLASGELRPFKTEVEARAAFDELRPKGEALGVVQDYPRARTWAHEGRWPS